MSNWVFDSGAQSRTLGILELRLSEPLNQVGPYERFALELRLRDGISVRNLSSRDVLAVLTVQAKSDFLARMEAENAATKWLAANLDRLCVPAPAGETKGGERDGE